MGQIKRRRKSGVFLTLGITFLSLIILGLATLILRNAESSDDRLRELAAFDRAYNLDRATGDAFRMYVLDVGKFSIVANTTNIILSKSTNRYLDDDFVLMVLSKGFFSIYLNTLYQNTILNSLPHLGTDFTYFGLNFERQKSGNDVWYRYLFLGNETNLTAGIVNLSYIHIVSFNASFDTINYRGPIGSLELVVKSDAKRSLNISVWRHKDSCTIGPCGTVRFRLKLLNFSNDPVCVPPYASPSGPSPPNADCTTWHEVIVSDADPQSSFLKEIYYIDGLFPGVTDPGPLRPTVLLGYFLYPVLSRGAFVALGVANGTLTTTYNINLTDPEKIRVFDAAVAFINVSGQQVGSAGPIRIL